MADPEPAPQLKEFVAVWATPLLLLADDAGLRPDELRDYLRGEIDRRMRERLAEPQEVPEQVRTSDVTG